MKKKEMIKQLLEKVDDLEKRLEYIQRKPPDIVYVWNPLSSPVYYPMRSSGGTSDPLHPRSDQWTSCSAGPDLKSQL